METAEALEIRGHIRDGDARKLEIFGTRFEYMGSSSVKGMVSVVQGLGSTGK